MITLKEARKTGQIERFISERKSLRADRSVFGRLLAAAACGANHLRARQWILAYPASVGDRLQTETVLPRRMAAECGNWWASESGICRVDDGTAGRVDRLRSLGNTVVPQIPEIIGHAILEAEK